MNEGGSWMPGQRQTGGAGEDVEEGEQTRALIKQHFAHEL